MFCLIKPPKDQYRMKDIGVVLGIYEWGLFYILINHPIAILNFSWQERSWMGLQR